MNREKRHSYIALSLIIVMMLVGSAIFLGLHSAKRSTSSQANGTTLRVTGTVVCLPHKDTNGPQTMECGIGIKDEKGQYYALGLGDNDLSNLPMNQSVTVEGTFEKVQESIYPIEGTIRITKIDQ